MLPTADATAVPVTPRELSVGPQPRRNVTVLPVLQTVAVPRVSVPSRKGAGRHVDPSLACELERLNYSAWLAVGEALASLTDKVIERGTSAAARERLLRHDAPQGRGARPQRPGQRRPVRGVHVHEVVQRVRADVYPVRSLVPPGLARLCLLFNDICETFCVICGVSSSRAAGPASTEEVQAMGTHLAERDGLGTRSWLAIKAPCFFSS